MLRTASWLTHAHTHTHSIFATARFCIYEYRGHHRAPHNPLRNKDGGVRKLRLTVDATRTAGAIRDEVLKRSEVRSPLPVPDLRPPFPSVLTPSTLPFCLPTFPLPP